MSDQLFPCDGEPIPAVPEKRRSREAYPQFDALVDLFGPPRTRSNQALYGKVANEMRDAGYSEADIHTAAGLYKSTYQHITITATALLKHIDQLMYENESRARTESYRQVPRLVVLPDLEAL